MSMPKRVKIRAGLWHVGIVVAKWFPPRRRGPLDAHRKAGTWRDPSGKILGYTLKDVEKVARARSKMVWCPIMRNCYA